MPCEDFLVYQNVFKSRRWKSIFVLGISRRIFQKIYKSEDNPRLRNRKYIPCSVCGLALSQGMSTYGIQWEHQSQLLPKDLLNTLKR